MKSKRVVLSVLSIATVAAVGYFAGHARAGGVPATAAMTYSGVLETSAGTPLSGSHSIDVTLWSQVTGGTAVCADPGASTLSLAGDGVFDFPLGDDCTAAVHASPDLWVQIVVDTQTMPRTKLGAVPYALEAGGVSTLYKGARYSGAAIYRGDTANVNMDGNLGGYQAAALKCQTAVQSATAHMCTSEDMYRSMSLGIPAPIGFGWVAGVSDCQGFTTTGDNGTIWAYKTVTTACNQGYPIHCCD